ncbi:dnaJ homolog subfamily C member 22-like [Lytechinus pictus]|uniref:dnaJ homolog subfamily C member 22-like n=1 Tax=Lytechinus pictus TaxID=7653 RepID=UPI0030B9B3A9
MVKKRSIAYFLWLVGGWFGLHHFYLGRDRHAFVWWCTLGGFFGLGWLRDLFCIGRYVDTANDEPSYVEYYTELLRKGRYPSFSISRFAGQLFVSAFFGLLATSAVPNDVADVFPILRPLLAPFAVALGVHLVGNIGREEGSLKNALIGAYIPGILLYADPNNIVYLSICSAVYFRKSVAYRRTPERWKTEDICERIVILGLAGALVCTAWGCAIYYNMSVTTAEGETIYVKDALTHFFESPAWKDFKEVIGQIWKLIQERGWKEAYNEFVEALDPEGEAAAHKTLELEEGASQEEITQRYRKLVRKWHPDKHKGEKKEEASIRFMEIQEAYERLSTINARRASHRKEHSFEDEPRRY